VQLKPAYALAQALDDKEKVNAIRREAARLTKEQRTRREADRPGVPATDVLKALLAASETEDGRPALPVVPSERRGRPLASLQSRNRQGMPLRLHAGAGANLEETVEAVRRLLLELEADGKGLQP